MTKKELELQNKLEEQKKKTFHATLQSVKVIITYQSDMNWQQGLLAQIKELEKI